MAERIVSPGVFTRETDLSFLPQAIGEIGAAIIGPTKKGPAFVPTQVTSFQEYEEIFGGQDDRFYTPQTVEQYLSTTLGFVRNAWVLVQMQEGYRSFLILENRFRIRKPHIKLFLCCKALF